MTGLSFLNILNYFCAPRRQPACREEKFMEKYILSEIFTLIPKDFYTPQMGKAALMEQFGLEGEYSFHSIPYNKENAVIAYALPHGLEYGEDGDCNALPFVTRLLEETGQITGYNKVVFHYNCAKKLSHTIICTGEELKLANSFKADSFESALYFLFLAIQQLQMNPKQCIVRVCCHMTPQQEAIISRFFNGIEVNNLDNLIQP